MNYQRYQQLARRTESLPDKIQIIFSSSEGCRLDQDLPTDAIVLTTPRYKYAEQELDYRLDHAAKGLTTEIAELFESDSDENKVEEIGDILWYLDLGAAAVGCTLDNLPFTTTKSDQHDQIMLVIYNGHLVDLLKRKKFYRKDDPQFEHKIKTLLSQILNHVVSICNDEGFSMVDVMEKNIEKLAKRYPDKYSDEAAVNRDLEKEKAVFEG